MIENLIYQIDRKAFYIYIYINVYTLLYGIYSGQYIKSTILIQFIFAETVFNNDEMVGFALIQTILGLSIAIANLYLTVLRSILVSMSISNLFYSFI